MRRALLFALVGLTATVQTGAAQSLFAARGLGISLPAVDARARALGGIGVGLLGFNTSLANPAEIAGAARRGITAALQPGSTSSEIGGETDGVDASRFPLIRLTYPLSSRLAMSLGYGSLLEQSWGVTLSSTEIIGADTVPVTDVIQSTGGLARFSVGLAFQLTPAIALGVAGGLNTGNIDRRVSRTFEDSTVGLLPFQTRLRWDYRGKFATGGVRLDLPDVLRVGAAITVSDELEIHGRDEGARDDHSTLPVRITGGASAVLSSTLLAAVGAEWNGGGTERVFQAADANALRRSTWRLGGGLEYGGWGSASRAYPIRLGGSWAQLPYYNEGETPGKEWSAAAGIGFRLSGESTDPGALADFSVERGGRTGLVSTQLPGGLTEKFWRVTFSLSLFMN